ncbi:hypothetical protein CTZ24_10795 [Pantoea phytobeneficialis]|uniref:Uncharacterized protein n=1 Tax=Pantoea phytobeneficialis TaxID=2052056 RepID=A0AAP9H520_9GAMM|nr:hypothetical protein CTZ24_10795 [Pantoea phytobeneficialis]
MRYLLPSGITGKIPAHHRQKSDRKYIYETLFYFYWIIILFFDQRRHTSWLKATKKAPDGA